LRQVLGEGAEEGSPGSGLPGGLAVAVVALACVYLSVDLTKLYHPGYNPWVGAWILLGEEGENLAWVQSIFSGGVFGKDFFCLYGPMLIYPLALFMRVFGETILVERLYTVFLNMIAYGTVFFFLYRTLRWRGLFLVFSLVYLFVFSPLAPVSPNTSYLRMVLGLLPILAVYLFLRRPDKRYLLALSGAIAGQSLLFSQEAGMCSVLAIGAMLFPWWISLRSWRRAAGDFSLLAAGCLISMAPMLLYFAVKGGLVPMLANLYQYPRLVTLGYGARPFPGFASFLSDPLSPATLYYYWAILVYAVAAAAVVPRILLGKVDRDTLLFLALVVYGILLYRIPLGRSAIDNVHKVAHPAYLLVFLFTDRAVTAVLDSRRIMAVRAGRSVFAALLLAATTVAILRTPSVFNFNKALLATSGLKPSAKLKKTRTGFTIPSLRRAGLYFDRQTTASITRIQAFLDSSTRPGDYVYFFPNEAAYYFLFNRNNPTRYAISYFAATSQQRRELVDDLERKRPEYVVYSHLTWRVDGIPEHIQVPEVVEYLKRRYQVHSQSADVSILKRIEE
jgi:hypothetical protein